MKTIKIKSAIPIYLAALIWILFGLFAPIYELIYIIIAACVSLAAYIVSSIFLPGRTVEVDAKPDSGDEAVNAQIAEGRSALRNLREADAAIEDEAISARLKRMTEAGGKIFDILEKEPSRATDLKAAYDKAEKSGLPEDAQAAKDLNEKCERFEKKLYDLELTRNISIQMAPQIRLIQSSNQLMAEKIQTSLNNTIPLWKSQMVLALGLAHTQSAMEAQRAVSDLTNELLLKNAEKLKMATTESAREAERGIVDIETLQQTNQMLIDTMDEVLTIQQEGRQKRQAAEGQLKVIENDLRNKLLELRK